MITDAIWLKNGKKINFFTIFYIGFRCNHLFLCIFGVLLLIIVFADLTLARIVGIECLIAVRTEALATIATYEPIIHAHLIALTTLLHILTILL